MHGWCLTVPQIIGKQRGRHDLLANFENSGDQFLKSWIIWTWKFESGRKIGQNISGIRALTVVKVNHRSGY